MRYFCLPMPFSESWTAFFMDDRKASNNKD